MFAYFYVSCLECFTTTCTCFGFSHTVAFSVFRVEHEPIFLDFFFILFLLHAKGEWTKTVKRAIHNTLGHVLVCA